MTNNSHTYVPVDGAALRQLQEEGRLAVSGEGVLVADAASDDETYVALEEATERSAERLVIEVEGAGPQGAGVTEFSLDQIVAIYVDLAWYGVQELGALVNPSAGPEAGVAGASD